MGHRLTILTAVAGIFLSVSLWGQQSLSPTPDSSAQANPQAAVPRLIRFSGSLQDLSGKPITGPADVTFSLYSVQSGGSALWFETQTVQADSLGNYKVLLGAMTPAGVPMELFTQGEARWLGVQVANLPEQPRVLLVSVPYAMKAGDAETLGGKPASAFMLAPQAACSGDVSSPTGGERSSPLQPDCMAAAAGTLSGLITSGGPNSATRTTPMAIAPGGAANYLAGWAADGTTLGKSVLYQDPSTSFVGIGTTAPSFPMDINNGSLGIGPKVPRPGEGGKLRARDDTGTLRWAVGIPGTAGSTDFFVSNAVNGHAPLFIQSNAPSYGLFLHASGRVGMGTTAPAFPLDVNGNAIGVGTQTPKAGYGGTVRFRDDTGTPRWAVGVRGETGQTTFSLFDLVNQREPFVVAAGAQPYQLYLSFNGNVGIGTFVPAAKLEVAGNAQVDGTMTATKFVGDGSGLTGIAVGGGATLGANTFTGTQTIASGDLTISNGNVNLPWTPTGGAAGVIDQGGSPFIHSCCLIGQVRADNTFVGYNSGNFTTTGIHNTAEGSATLSKVTTGWGNTATGYSSLLENTTGTLNTATGAWALADNDTGLRNTAVGECALGNTSGTGAQQLACEGFETLTMGSGNTGVGTWAGRANTIGVSNTFLGNDAEPAVGNLINATALGANALVGASNSLVLGSINGVNNATASVNVGIGTTTPAQRLDVNGNLQISGAGNALIFPDGTVMSSAGSGGGVAGGTITGVTAGTGLSGGGSVGNVTLSLAVGNVNGVKEFTANGSFVIPPGITHLMVEMWGGGGAGGPSSGCGTGTPSAGGAGGGGAYTRDVIPVVPGALYNIVVGAGGAGTGDNGGDSQIVDTNLNVLTFAGGGLGGSATAGGAGGQADPNAAISHSGVSGVIGTAPPGTLTYAYNLAPNMNYGNGGGTLCGAGQPGSQGYVLLTW